MTTETEPTGTPQQSTLPEEIRVFREKAEAALRDKKFDEALALAEAALKDVLEEGVSADAMVERGIAGAELASVLRGGNAEAAVQQRLLEPLALRWEALRRAGRADDAKKLREVCLRWLPEQASVWATAGYHSLEDKELEEAERCFDRCLTLAPRWSAALSGKALALEARQQFEAALPYRQQVVVVERALERNDPPSVQRLLRLAAVLAQLGRMGQAEPLFRRCVALGAGAVLPADRPMLFRLFTFELYAPAMLITVLTQAKAQNQALPREMELPLKQAQALGRIFQAVSKNEALEPGVRGLALGTCAWLVGDCAQAYTLLDQAEADAEGDLTIQWLLLCSAQALSASELPSIGKFAREAAMTRIERARSGEATPDLVQALLVLEQLGERELARATLAELGEAHAAALAVYRDALANADQLLTPLELSQGEPVETLRALVTFQLAQRAAGRTPRAVAESIDAALHAIAAAVA